METPRIRVMLADDDAGLLEALADTIRAATDLELVGTARTAEDAISQADATMPDVILMDVRMPIGGGVSATRAVLERRPELKVVALSAHEDTASALHMLEVGAVAYIAKGVAESEILDAIRRAYRGQMSISAELGSTAFRDLLRENRERRESEQSLRKSERLGSAILEAVPDAVVIVDESGTIEFVNAQAARLFGHRREDMLGRPMGLLVREWYRDDHEAFRAIYAEPPRAPGLDSCSHFTARRSDGSEFPVDISLSAVDTDDGLKSIATIRAVTTRTGAEDAQRRSERLFRGLLDSAPDALVITDSSGAIQVVNKQAEELFGYSREELRGQSVDCLVPERFRAAHVRHRLGYMEHPVARTMGADLALLGRRNDGTEFPADISVSPMQSETGTLIIAAVRDVTDRDEARRKVDENTDTLQRKRLFARLIGAQEEERLRIASDIHDDTIQAMTATTLRMQQLRRHLVEPDQIAILAKLEDTVRESINRLRRLMFDLRPASLDRSGLASALRELLERLEDETQVTFTLENHLASEPVRGLRTAMYRIAQEALANVKKHASAKVINVELSNVGAGCRVRICDDGRGFDIQGSDSKAGHLGLVSMRERAQIAGGWLTISCPPEGGTVVEFWLPLGAESEPGEAGR